MAAAKKDMFSVEDQELAAFALAIAHPARIAILKLLANEEGCICGEIVDRLPLAQSTVSQHLKGLKKNCLIKTSIDGPKICYCINWDTVEKYNRTFIRLFETLQIQQIKSSC